MARVPHAGHARARAQGHGEGVVEASARVAGEGPAGGGEVDVGVGDAGDEVAVAERASGDGAQLVGELVGQDAADVAAGAAERVWRRRARAPRTGRGRRLGHGGDAVIGG